MSFLSEFSFNMLCFVIIVTLTNMSFIRDNVASNNIPLLSTRTTSFLAHLSSHNNCWLGLINPVIFLWMKFNHNLSWYIKESVEPLNTELFHTLVALLRVFCLRLFKTLNPFHYAEIFVKGSFNISEVSPGLGSNTRECISITNTITNTIFFVVIEI